MVFWLTIFRQAFPLVPLGRLLPVCLFNWIGRQVPPTASSRLGRRKLHQLPLKIITSYQKVSPKPQFTHYLRALWNLMVNTVLQGSRIKDLFWLFQSHGILGQLSSLSFVEKADGCALALLHLGSESLGQLQRIQSSFQCLHCLRLLIIGELALYSKASSVVSSFAPQYRYFGSPRRAILPKYEPKLPQSLSPWVWYRSLSG